jgi:hypothetical protein
MQKLSSPPWAGARLLPAFEECCAALRALELSVATDANQEPERQRHLCTAVALLREAIGELRSLSNADPSPTAAGFVLPSEQSPGTDH